MVIPDHIHVEAAGDCQSGLADIVSSWEGAASFMFCGGAHNRTLSSFLGTWHDNTIPTTVLPHARSHLDFLFSSFEEKHEEQNDGSHPDHADAGKPPPPPPAHESNEVFLPPETMSSAPSTILPIAQGGNLPDDRPSILFFLPQGPISLGIWLAITMGIVVAIGYHKEEPLVEWWKNRNKKKDDASSSATGASSTGSSATTSRSVGRPISGSGSTSRR